MLDGEQIKNWGSEYSTEFIVTRINDTHWQITYTNEREPTVINLQLVYDWLGSLSLEIDCNGELDEEMNVRLFGSELIVLQDFLNHNTKILSGEYVFNAEED